MGAPAGTRPKRPLVGREADSSSDSSCDHVDCRFSTCSQNCWTIDGQLRCSLIPRCKLEDLQQKAQEVRKERERMFEEHARERNVLHQHSLDAAKRRELTQITCLTMLERDFEVLTSPRSKRAAKRTQQQDIERHEREESLEEYRKKFDGVRGFSKASGRVRTFRKNYLGVPQVSFRSKAANPKQANPLSAKRQRRRRM